MEQVLQAAALCVTASLLAMVVRRGSPETALLLALGAAAVVLAALADPLAQVLAFAEELGRRSGISEELLAPLYKTVAIALVVRVGGSLCRDAGESALGAVVETAGAVCALLAALPLVQTASSLLWELME